MTTQKYGPQTPEIEALIAKIETISLDQARALAAAWDAAWNDALDAAVRNAALAAVRNAVRDAAWAVALDAAWDALDAAWDALDAALAAAWAVASAAAWNAAWDAVLALMVRDLISGDQFDVLYGPWASVMEAEK